MREKNEAIGNAAAMRAALEAARDLILPQCNGGTAFARACGEVANKIMAALSEPPRNCDRFATADDAREAHEAICKKYVKCHHGCPQNNEEHYSAFDCFEAWLFASAEWEARNE